MMLPCDMNAGHGVIGCLPAQFYLIFVSFLFLPFGKGTFPNGNVCHWLESCYFLFYLYSRS